MILFSVLALLSLIYYVIIICYSGIATSYSLIWLLGSGGCFLMAAGARYYRKNPDRVPLWIPVSAVTVCIAGAVLLLITEVVIFTGAVHSVPRNLDYVIVLGAGIRGDQVTKVLKNRLDRAIEYLEDNPGTILVLSGGMGQGESIPEAQAMRNYLQYNGITDNQMILELQSTSTVENIVYSRVLIDEVRARQKQALPAPHFERKVPVLEAPDRPIRIGIITSDFHVFRAVSIAKKRNFTEVYGIPSDSDPVLFLHFCIREGIAVWKDKIMGNM